jgi:hypothetical protein
MAADPPDFDRIRARQEKLAAQLRDTATRGGVETPDVRRRRRLSELVALAILVALAALNALWFAALDSNYFTWFLDNGSLIALLFTVVSATVELDDNVGLIAADPLNFANGVVRVFLELSSSLWALFGPPRSGLALWEAGLSELQTRFRWPWMDLAFAWAFLGVFSAAMLAWAIVIAPLQYWLTLVCGAPGRTAVASRRTIWRVNRGRGHTEYLNAPKDLAELLPSERADLEDVRDRRLATQISFATKPVTLTSAISAVALWAASQLA